jgi:hypothetical protein
MTTSPLVKGAKPIAVKDLNIKKRNPTIEDFNFPDGLPTADDLPDSDDTPVDSELQELIPGLLKAILMDMWGSRKDWLFRPICACSSTKSSRNKFNSLSVRSILP